MPEDTPVTTPVDPTTVAIPVLPLLHTPPDEASVKPMDEPMQTADGPMMLPATGTGFTVTSAVAAAAPQPVVTV